MRTPERPVHRAKPAISDATFGSRARKGTGSGTIYYYYDENRLTNITSGTTYKTDFAYDGLGRLRIRTEYTYSGGWYVSSTTRYIYDGMRVIQERNASNTPLVAYTRGQDLSGSVEGLPRGRSRRGGSPGASFDHISRGGAVEPRDLSRGEGGIGGPLERSSGYAGGSWGTHSFYHADGNGNVTYLATALLSTAASYKYDPYGSAFSVSDTIGNVYRFSSKEQHLNSGFYYYGYRFYAPSLQRWPNRDPLGEPGFELLRQRQPNLLGDGPNLYTFTHNNPVNYYDVDGCVAPVLIFSVGNAINNGILARYYCYQLKKCLGTAHDYAQRAAEGMDPEDYLRWLNAAKPGSECTELAKGCGVSVIKLTCWVGARFLVLRYEALNPIVK